MPSIVDASNSVIAIFRKELRGYFTSPIAYVVAAAFWILAGFFFVNFVVQAVNISQQFDVFNQPGQTFDAPMEVSRRFLSLLGTLSLFILPSLTMGLYAEERRRGTMELLATSPITNLAVAVGKWLAVLVYYITLLIPLLAYQVLAYSSTRPMMDYRQMLFGYLGLVLMAGSVMALGLFVSSLTDSTLVAAVGTFGIVLLLWVIDAAAGQNQGILADALRHLSLLQQFGSWVQGVVSTSSLVLFLSMIVLGLFLTVQSVEALRWQQN
ncbi:MAG: ABC transporter permease subunit [Cyanobacteriota bacterium]|nr:ABC transporter permease subunit [Cyanobacteriota bacterium]